MFTSVQRSRIKNWPRVNELLDLSSCHQEAFNVHDLRWKWGKTTVSSSTGYFDMEFLLRINNVDNNKCFFIATKVKIVKGCCFWRMWSCDHLMTWSVTAVPLRERRSIWSNSNKQHLITDVPHEDVREHTSGAPSLGPGGRCSGGVGGAPPRAQERSTITGAPVGHQRDQTDAPQWKTHERGQRHTWKHLPEQWAWIRTLHLF